MDINEGITGLETITKSPILSLDFIEKLRETEDGKKDSKCFIAQSGAQERGLGNCADITVFGGNRGGGKANTYNTKVVTPSGYRRMGDLEIGDLICTPYEGVQKVSAIFEQGEQVYYTFHFDDGTTLDCMDNHRFWARLKPDEKFREMEAREIMNQYIIDRPFPMSLRANVQDYVEVPLCGEVEMNEKKTHFELPIHPTVLGYSCGDGLFHFERYGLHLIGSTYNVRMLYSVGCKRIIKHRTNGKYYVRGISKEARRRITSTLQPKPAFVPDEYMNASISARMDYLRGIMFNFGRSQKKHPYLELPNKNLIMQVAEIARSLGMWARVSRVEDNPDTIGYYRVSFIAPNDKDLFIKSIYVARAHVNADKPKSPNTKSILTKKIVRITKSKHKAQCRCITITGKHHLYMTEGFTINHNTVTMLMEPLYDIANKHFNGIIFRRNKDDFENIINEGGRWFGQIGKYNKSKDDMTWNFKTGAKIGLDYYDMPMSDFDIKYRGQQFAYIGIDELPQMPFEMFKFIQTCNRNTVGVHSRILGTCNPDPLSWLRKFLDWWIGKADTIYSDGKIHPELKGFAIPERNGKVRYCYMPDNSVDNIIWGDTPEEVYEQCKELIDDAWDESWSKLGYTKTSFFVKSVTFIKASLNENRALLKNDPGYIASLLNQPPEVRAREFDGNWDVIKASNDLIQPTHMDRIFQNAHMLDDGVRRATCDIAGTGGDNCVTWFWIGWHVADVYVCRRDPYTTAKLLEAKLREWGVLEQNFSYDLNGMGQVLKGAFPKAVPFNNLEAVDKRDKNLYDNKKSQCAYKFAERTQQGGWSIENTLLSRKYKIGKDVRTLYDILQLERKCIRQDMSKQDKGWCIIHKEQMKSKSIVGHSPDFFEALFMREIFELKHSVSVPNWARGTSKHLRITRLSPR